MNPGHFHNEICADCGQHVWVRHMGGHAYLCDECRDERRSQRRKAAYRKYCAHHKSNGLNVKIVHDPDREYGFPDGATFSMDEFHFDMDLGNYTVGTILLVKGARKMIGVVDGLAQLMEA